jgi:hypothetical protein
VAAAALRAAAAVNNFYYFNAEARGLTLARLSLLTRAAF